ncbi:acyl carrier protein [Pseudomonadota bacterium]
MNSQQILEKLQDLLENDFDIEREKVTPDARLYDDLDIDSIDTVDLMAWMVKLTGKRVKPEDFRNVRTIGDLIEELKKQLS